MVSDCKDYETKGYCIKGRGCPYSHSNDMIELDISDYDGLIEAMRKATAEEAAQTKERQSELKRKQADLLNNLLNQQKILIKKIELCTDDAEKARLKAKLDEMSLKTKDWIESDSTRTRRQPTAGTSSTKSKFVVRR